MKRILLAEDDRFLRRAAETRLRRRGFEVRTAMDGDEAVALALAEPPDLVLLDLLMPKRDGLQVLKALRASETTRLVPVVILSNSSNEFEFERAFSLGAVAYWVKANLSLQDLCDRIDKLLGCDSSPAQ